MAENYILLKWRKMSGFRSHLQVLWHFVCSFLTLALFLSTQTWIVLISVDFRYNDGDDFGKPESRDIILDLIDIVLSHSLVLRLPLLLEQTFVNDCLSRGTSSLLLHFVIILFMIVIHLGDISPDKVPHDGLVLQISFACLSHLALQKSQLFLKLSWCRSKRLFLKLTMFRWYPGKNLRPRHIQGWIPLPLFGSLKFLRCAA